MQFIDLSAQQARIKDRIDSRIEAVLAHGKYIMGPEITELEEKLADFAGSRQAVSCSSGTDALLMALMALGVGPNDAVLTVPFTFIATAEVISLLGATPVFVDIDPQTFNIDPEKLEKTVQSLKQSNLNPKVVIAVDMFGLPADYEPIQKIADANGMNLIEDAAQSFGAEYKGQKTCSFGDIACTSFFPAKPLGCYGDGGMCFTNDEHLAEIMRSLRIHGKGTDKYDNIRIGLNGRLDTLQAAILLAKMEIFPEEIKFRQAVVQRYESLFKRFDISGIAPPFIPDDYMSAWAQYSILAKDETRRSQLQEKLKEKGIPTAIYYPKPLHLQTAFSFLGYQEGEFPESEQISKRIFSIPMHPYLKAEDQETIVTSLKE